jgi:hypothetical protein
MDTNSPLEPILPSHLVLSGGFTLNYTETGLKDDSIGKSR